MLKKIDTYIIKKYLSTFFFTILLITMIAITIDFFEKVDKFMRPSVPNDEIILDYFLNFIPWINGLLWPLFALLAVIFFTSRMAKNSEIVAILASGVSYYRLLLPFMVAAGILATLLWIGNNYVIPNSTRIKNEFESKYIYKSNKKALSNDIHFFTGPEEKVYIRYFRLRDSTPQNFRLERFADHELVYVLKAKSLKLKEKPNLWTLKNYEIHTFDGMKENLIIGKGETMDTTLNFAPEDFIRYAKQMEMMTTSDLKSYIANEKNKGIDTSKKFLVELHRRNADPFTILILTLLGVAVASRKVRGGMGFHLATGVVLGACFVIISKFSMTFSSNLSLSPALGVWLPNMVFGVIAIVMIWRTQK